MSPEQQRRRTRLVLLLLSLLALAAVAAFMLIGVRGNWGFVMAFRGEKLAALALVAAAIAAATVLFQTVVNNRILTPSIMGFDALYVLIQTLLVFFLGSASVAAADRHLLFAAEVGCLVLFAGLLFRWLFTGAVRSLHLLLLVGVVFGVLFRSIAGFLQRVIDPSEFLILQDRLFASFNAVDTALLWAGLAAIGLAGLAVWRLLPVLDVMALGRDNAISLGVEHRRAVTLVLGLVTLLVAVSTALVGPVTFFGLLVANLAYRVVPSARHAAVLPAAVLLALIFLIGGQAILERLLAFETALAVVIEFVGGIVFILLVIRGAAR